MAQDTLLKAATKKLGREPDLIVNLYDLTIEHDSARHLKETGRTRSEVIGEHSRNFVDLESNELIGGAIKEIVMRGQARLKINVRKKNGGILAETFAAKMAMIGPTPYALMVSETLDATATTKKHATGAG